MKSMLQNFGLLAIVAMALLACQAQTNFTKRDQGDSNLDPLSDESLKGSHALQTKTLNSVIEAMSVRTGVYPFASNMVTSSNEADLLDDLREEIMNNTTTLPIQSDAVNLQAAHLLAVFNMAYEYCKVFIDAETFRAEVFEGSDFEVIPTSGNTNGLRDSVLTGGNIQILVDTLLNQFWGARINPSPARVAARADLIALVEDIRPSVDDNSTGLRQIMYGVCATALSSAPALLQ